MVDASSWTMSCFSDRYARNQSLTASEQVHLGAARVLVVGLGGLGGHVLDMLVRTGVSAGPQPGRGLIVGVDGDFFEASNLNRQLLCTESNLGRSKAVVAAEYVATINSAARFEALPVYLRGADFVKAVQGMDVVVDALGGLRDRAALHKAASDAGVVVVAAGIAGFSGWVASIQPKERGPTEYFGSGQGVEEQLGNLAPTAALAAALQAAEVISVLAGRPAQTGLLLFDLADRYFTQVQCP